MLTTSKNCLQGDKNAVRTVGIEESRSENPSGLRLRSIDYRSFISQFAAFALIGATVVGCAPKASEVAPTYVPASKYYNQSCSQLLTQRNDIVRQLNVLIPQQAEKASNDAMAVGVGAILFWPALFFIGSGNDNSAQVAGLKGEYDALTSAGGSKNCFAS